MPINRLTAKPFKPGLARQAGTLMVLALLVSACGQRAPAELMLDDYQTRLARSLDVANVSLPTMVAPTYPPRRQLSQPLTSVKVDLLEFLRLSRCDLQRLVGQRNSGLGRVMSHSQRWLYEAQFIHAGEICLRLLLADPEQTKMATVLQQALALKQAERRYVTWNASFASDEFQRLFSLSTPPLAPDYQRPGELIAALADLRWRIQRWHGAQAPPGADLEALYQIIGAGRWLGQLSQSLTLINRHLTALNRIQQARLQGRPLCFNGRSNARAEILQNVFFKYYIGRVQPYLARVNQDGAAVLAELQKLRLLSAAEPPGQALFDDYWAVAFAPVDDDPATPANGGRAAVSQWQHFSRLLAEHTQNWQAQLRQCGLMPGQ